MNDCRFSYSFNYLCTLKNKNYNKEIHEAHY